jgi:hypothetical protein
MTEETKQTPRIVDAIRAVLAEDFDDDREYNRLELRVTQSGSVPYRLYPRDGSDYDGGVAFADPRS